MEWYALVSCIDVSILNDMIGAVARKFSKDWIRKCIQKPIYSLHLQMSRPEICMLHYNFMHCYFHINCR
jgi:hypothetical protein